jgi:hypothetical protein
MICIQEIDFMLFVFLECIHLVVIPVNALETNCFNLYNNLTVFTCQKSPFPTVAKSDAR